MTVDTWVVVNILLYEPLFGEGLDTPLRVHNPCRALEVCGPTRTLCILGSPQLLLLSLSLSLYAYVDRIYIYMHIHVTIHIHIRVHVYIYICTHTDLSAYLPTCLPTYLPTYLPTDPATCLHTHLPTYLPTYLQNVIHQYIYISMYIWKYIYVDACMYITRSHTRDGSVWLIYQICLWFGPRMKFEKSYDRQS